MTGYSGFLIQLGIIIVSIFILYRLIAGNRFGNRLLGIIREPLLKRIREEAPDMEEVFHLGSKYGIYPTMVKSRSKYVGLPISQANSIANLHILSIDRANTFITKPDTEERILSGDRLLVYGSEDSVKHLVL